VGKKEGFGMKDENLFLAALKVKMQLVALAEAAALEAEAASSAYAATSAEHKASLARLASLAKSALANIEEEEDDWWEASFWPGWPDRPW